MTAGDAGGRFDGGAAMRPGDGQRKPGLLPEGCSPVLDNTTAVDFFQAVRCIFEGDRAVQTGVEAGVITPERVSVLRGVIRDREGQPLPDVRVRVLRQTRYGETRTGPDGTYNLAVNGGGQLTLCFEREGFMRVQRHRDVPHRRFVPFPSVMMIARNPVAGRVPLDEMQAPVLVRGPVEQDRDGQRAHALMFRPGTRAMAMMPSGQGVELSDLTVRVTEFTVGERGSEAMPGDLPANSGFTYAADLSVDEAEAMGAMDLVFDPPLVSYVDNFLGFPAGTAVPVGFYNEEEDVWESAESGIVLDIVDVVDGKAVIDLDDDGRGDSPADLTLQGIDEQERALLAVRYEKGRSLWRTPVPHFSTVDLNWGTTLPEDGVEPEAHTAVSGPEDCRAEVSGSIIGCEDQTLGEVLPVPGTPFSLHYQSERMPGRLDTRQVEIMLSGDSVPNSLVGVELEVTVLGQVLRKHFEPAPNLKHVFRWDGRDAYDRAWQGRQPALIRVGYTYPGQYATTARFADNPALAITGSSSRREVTLWKSFEEHVGTFDASARGLGGWSLNAHHVYDRLGGVLHRGDGRQRASRRLGQRIARLGGSGQDMYAGDGGHARQASLLNAADVVAAPDGTIYLSEDEGHRIRRITSDGVIHTYAGTGQPGVGGDGGPATLATVGNPHGLALSPDGTLYVAQRADRVIRAIAPDGTIRTIAGGGTPEDGVGDGGSALAAEFVSPYGLALDASGTLYVSDLAEFTEDLRQGSRVRAIAPDGSIRTVAGGGELRLASYDDGSLRILAGEPKSEEGILATEADLVTPVSIVVDREGALYIAETDAFRVRKVTPDGRITRIAGNGLEAFSGEGGPALSAGLRPWGLALDGGGNLYVADNTNARVRRIRPDGLIETVAGDGSEPTRAQARAGGAALTTPVGSPTALEIDGEGRLLLLQRPSVLARVEDALPTFARGDSLVASASGDVAFQFGEDGRHLATFDALTNVPLLEFVYDDRGLLVALTDRDGNRTEIERDGAGDPTAIVGPYGKRTELTVDDRGLLTRVALGPDEAYAFDYDDGGLLTRMTGPRSTDEHHLFEYDEVGRLVRDEGPTGFYQTLGREVTGAGVQVTRTERDDRTYRYSLEPLADDRTVRKQLDPAGLATTIEVGAATVVRTPTQKVTRTMQADPRFFMQAPFPTSTVLEIKDGPTWKLERRREVKLTERGAPLDLERYRESMLVNGREATMIYDALTGTMTMTTPMGRTTVIERDNQGRPAQLRIGTRAPTDYAYDGRGRVVQMKTGERTLGYEYGSNGQVAAVIDPLGQRVELQRNALGRPVAFVLEDGQTVHSSYEAPGLLASIEPPARGDHEFNYGPGNLLASYVPPALPGHSAADTETHYSYDPFDMLSELAPPGGDSLVIGYQDATGRPVSHTFPSDRVTYDYHEDTGLLASVSSVDAVMAFDYTGPLLARVAWSGEVTGAISFDYDDNLWTTTQTIAGETIAYAYDDDGLTTQAGSEEITRDADNGWISSVRLGDLDESLRFSRYAELSEHVVSYAADPLYVRHETRDPLGRVVSRQETILGETTSYEYSYDARGRLASVQAGGVTTTYAYDENGNRTERVRDGRETSASYDPQDRLVRYGGTEFTFTLQGSLAEKVTGEETTRYQYDLLGSLRAVELPDGRSIEYLIDGLGRRIGKRVDGALTQALLYQDALNPVAELDAEGAVVSTFVYASRPHVPDYMLREGTEYKLVTDAIGSVRLVVDAATGEVAQRIDYDEFGNVSTDTNPGFQPFGFAGGLYDADTGLVRFGARDYDPMVGRWTAKDPSLFIDGTNLYSYSHQDPVNLIDVTGEDAIFIHYDYYPVDTGLGFKAPLGHAAVIAVDPATGRTKYYEYGRYGSSFGRVRPVSPIPDLVMGEDGRPTADSMKNLTNFLSKNIGKGSSVSYRYFDDADHRKVIDYAERMMRDRNRDPYSVWTNNCKTFANDAIQQAR